MWHWPLPSSLTTARALARDVALFAAQQWFTARAIRIVVPESAQ